VIEVAIGGIVLIGRRDLGDFKFGTIFHYMRESPSIARPVARPRTPALSRWGGARRGAGRPARSRPPSQPHKRRRAFFGGELLHVTARITRAVGSLNRVAARAAIDRALSKSRARSDFRIASLAIAPPLSRPGTPRLELIVEAADHHALARGMQGFQVSLARGLNASAKRRGTVFVDRYVARPVRRRSSRASS